MKRSQQTMCGERQKAFTTMKSKLCLLTTVALLAWSVTGHSQNTPAASESADTQTPAAVAAAPETATADTKPAGAAEAPAATEAAGKPEAVPHGHPPLQLRGDCF